MKNEKIYIVDDDPAVRDALSVILSMDGYEVEEFADGRSFLDQADLSCAACVLLDVHMPDKSGIEVLKKLQDRNYSAPVFMISGQGSIPMAVESIRNGAFDFIEKPFTADTILGRIKSGIADRADRHSNDGLADHDGATLLTQREREVLQVIIGGASNKEAGRLLDISHRTVEVHRARIMEKLGARNIADLVRIVLGRE